MMDAIKKQIPNLFTMGNLCCGVFAIILINHDRFVDAAYCILLAVVFDFFDGFLARLFKVSGELGKQLDSLADLVTFGVAPATMLYVYAIHNDLIYAKYAFLFLVIFSAYRLGKFNLDTRQSTSFIGVPTPITGVMVTSFAFIEKSHPSVFSFLFTDPFIFTVFCITISLLLVSEIPLPALKIKKGPIKDFRPQFMLLIVSIFCILFFQWLAAPIIYCFYVLSSVIINFAANKKE